MPWPCPACRTLNYPEIESFGADHYSCKNCHHSWTVHSDGKIT